MRLFKPGALRQAALAICALACPSLGLCADGPQWKVQFFHDVDDSELTITDLAFPSSQRGIAAGILSQNGRLKPTLVVTSDGGKKWNLVPVDDTPLSLFFLTDSIGWMVTEKGIWRTEEAGMSWRKVSKRRGVYRVYFLDENHGFAAAEEKTIYETLDGGKEWVALAVTDKVETNPEHTVFTWIEFANRQVGSIVGWSRPARRRESEFPDWMDPEAAQRRRQWPTSTIIVQTVDGGKTWQPTITSMFGRITRLRLRGAHGLTLVEFQDAFEYPSEVYYIDREKNKTERVFREKDRAVTDIALTGTRAYLAAVQTTGKLQQSPIPGRLVLLTSKDFTKWTPMEVDYRAYARRAIICAVDEQNVWVATDTGMILKLADGS